MADHKSIHEAMVGVMSDVDPIAKSRTNSGQNYKFRGVDDVYQALQAVMVKHGVFTTSEIVGTPQYDDFNSGKSGTLTFRTRAQIKFTFHHVSGTSVSSETIGEGMDSGDKATNKAMSVAHKYALLQAFLIPTDEPKDPEDDDHAPTSRVERQAPPPEKPKLPDYMAQRKLDMTKIFEAKSEYGELVFTPKERADAGQRFMSFAGLDPVEMVKCVDDFVQAWKIALSTKLSPELFAKMFEGFVEPNF